MRYHKSPPVISTLADVVMLYSKVRSLARAGKVDIIHCRSYVTSLVGLRMRRRYKIPFVFDMRGFWADERIESGLWNIQNPLYKRIYNFFKIKEREFVAEADCIITLTQKAKSEIISWKLNHRSITVIPTCVDMNHFDPALITVSQKLALRSKLGIPERSFVLMYPGSWGTWYLTREMLDFFSCLKQQYPEARFLILTPDKPDIDGFKFKSDVVIRKVSRQDMPLHIAIADAAVFFIRPSYSKMASAATKMGEILAMNIPVITNPGWGDAEDILQFVGGVLWKPGETLPLIIPDELHISQKSRTYCAQALSLVSGVDAYDQVYQSLPGRSSVHA